MNLYKQIVCAQGNHLFAIDQSQEWLPPSLVGNLVPRQSQPQDTQLPLPPAMSKCGSRPAVGNRHLRSIAARPTVARHQLRCTSMSASTPAQTSASISANMGICDKRQQVQDPAGSPCIARRKYFPALAGCHDGMHHMRLTLAPSSGASCKPKLPHAILASSPELRPVPACPPQARSSAADLASGRVNQSQACRRAADSASQPVQTVPNHQIAGSASTQIAGKASLCKQGQWQAGPRPGMGLDRSAAAQTALWAATKGTTDSAIVAGPIELPRVRTRSAATTASSATDGTVLLGPETLNQAHCPGPERSGLSSAGPDQSAPQMVRSCIYALLMLWAADMRASSKPRPNRNAAAALDSMYEFVHGMSLWHILLPLLRFKLRFAASVIETL